MLGELFSLPLSRNGPRQQKENRNEYYIPHFTAGGRAPAGPDPRSDRGPGYAREVDRSASNSGSRYFLLPIFYRSMAEHADILMSDAASMAALPIPAPVNRYRRPHRQPHDGADLLAIRHPAVILAPRALLRIPDQIRPGDVVVVPDLAAT